MKTMLTFNRNAKKVYYVDGRHFISDKGTRNGKEKAKQYCYDNMINPDSIIVFDSEMEFKRYAYLIALQIKDKISGLSLHHTFLIQPAFTDIHGIPHNEITYEADFYYLDSMGTPHVEDVKGFEEDEFRLKEKLFDYAFKSKNLCIDAIRLKPRCDHMLAESWELLSDIKGKPKKTTVKLREDNAELKKTLYNAQKDATKLKKVKERYSVLTNKEKLSKAEKTRLEECRAFLIEKGMIL